MTNLIRVLDNNNLDFKLNFSDGYCNLILFDDENARMSIIKYVYNMCEINEFNSPYFISGFDLKPYLNLSENIYEKFGIDLDVELKERIRFSYYCQILNFKWVNINFSLLSNINKLKSVFISSFFSVSKIILFDEFHYFKFEKYVNFILYLINKFNLFSDKVFVRIKKQVFF